MGFGALRNIIRPLARSFLTHNTSRLPAPKIPNTHSSPFPLSEFRSVFDSFQQLNRPWSFTCNGLHSLTDTRLPKRRPSLEPKRKRRSLRPKGPYAWVQYTPGEPILANKPNEGSVKRRNEKKRMRLKRAFILSEKKKRKAQLQEANRKKRMQRIERKMAAVARDRAWAERLAELQKLEAEKLAQT